MKALSVRQPWASAIAWGEKSVEHRSWSTDYRGPLLIHASGSPFALELDGGDTMPLPYGVIIARVELVDVHPFTAADCAAACMEEPRKGFAWVFSSAQELQAVRAKGKLHLWEWEGNLEELPVGGMCHVEAWHEGRAGVVMPPALSGT